MPSPILIPAEAPEPTRTQGAPGLQSFLDELLADQRRLETPVARFASAHEAGVLPGSVGNRHAELLPLSAPQPGEQYAFEVDLDSCTGCKSCVSACHSLNGLDETETWRDVGLLVSEDPRQAYTQTITTACHHCADPACLNGCPVLAYEKDPVTGIVRHLDDQCIGCSYCILKCPYDVPKYSARRGIVRKCDLCHTRLAHGEAPACAQACPTHAIRIVTVKREVSPAFLAQAPDASYTQPTTQYISQRGVPTTAIAADLATPRPQPAHWPLVILLTLMPLAIGIETLVACEPLLPFALDRTLLLRVAWLIGGTALAASVAHLGQPLRAWRIFLGLRRSWLSREAVGLGLWFGGLTALGVQTFIPLLASPHTFQVLAAVTAAIGTGSLFCSVMVYVDTHRSFWRFRQTAPRFFGTGLVLGLAAAFAAPLGKLDPAQASLLAAALTAMLAIKLVVEAFALARMTEITPPSTAAQRSAQLLHGRFRGVVEARMACALGGLVLAWLAAGPLPFASIGWAQLALLTLGEFLERSLFFRAVDAPKMPGMPTRHA